MRGCAILALPSDGEAELGFFEERAQELLAKLRKVIFPKGLFYIFTDGSPEGRAVGDCFHLSVNVGQRVEIHHPELVVPQVSDQATIAGYLKKLMVLQEVECFLQHRSVIVILAKPRVAQAFVEMIWCQGHITNAMPRVLESPIRWGEARVVLHGGNSIDRVSVIPDTPGQVTRDDVERMSLL